MLIVSLFEALENMACDFVLFITPPLFWQQHVQNVVLERLHTRRCKLDLLTSQRQYFMLAWGITADILGVIRTLITRMIKGDFCHLVALLFAPVSTVLLMSFDLSRVTLNLGDSFRPCWLEFFYKQFVLLLINLSCMNLFIVFFLNYNPNS